MERRLGYSDLAIRHLEKAVALNPKYTEALLELGYCYLISKRYDKAEVMARVLLEANPKNVQARLLIGDTEALAGSYIKALAGIKTLCTECPDDPLLFLRKGDLNLVLGNKTQARAAYLKATAEWLYLKVATNLKRDTFPSALTQS
jgi:tetratricopeptide (TPR) repeat protein